MTVADLITAFVKSGASMDTEVLMQAGSDPEANLKVADVTVRNTLVVAEYDHKTGGQARRKETRVILSWDWDRYGRVTDRST